MRCSPTCARSRRRGTRTRAVQGALATLAQGLGEELLAVDLDRVLLALGEIVGITTPDDLLERIFAEFCIGK